jgi:predicted DCC family thiol-disulfide oxidoreductase YuxK
MSNDAVGPVLDLERAPPYAWRANPDVPAFDDTRPLIVFDGVCVFCSHSMQFIAQHDTKRALLFTAAQSPLGQALFKHHGLDPVNFETFLVLENGRALGRRDALVAVGRHMSLPWRWLALPWRWLPRALADRAYDAIATRRYRLFGRYDTCFAPDPSWRSRVIE